MLNLIEDLFLKCQVLIGSLSIRAETSELIHCNWVAWNSVSRKQLWSVSDIPLHFERFPLSLISRENWMCSLIWWLSIQRKVLLSFSFLTMKDWLLSYVCIHFLHLAVWSLWWKLSFRLCQRPRSFIASKLLCVTGSSFVYWQFSRLKRESCEVNMTLLYIIGTKAEVNSSKVSPRTKSLLK